MNKQLLKNMIDTAQGRKAADLCIKNCRVVDVFNRTVFSSDVYITEGMIAGFGDGATPEAKETFDAKGAYLAPGLIDSHVHIESSHLSPAEFSKQVVPCGVTTVVADPHEICNVCGLDGFHYMLEATEHIALQVLLQFPSCVPSTPYENAGAVLEALEIHTCIGHERVLGLGELMDYTGACAADEKVLDKIMEAKRLGKVIDGHSPHVSGSFLDAYSSCGIRNDHECAQPSELQDRIRRGMYVLLRQGTAAQDLVNLLPGVTPENAPYCLFCTDDRQAASLLKEGSIDNNIRLSIKHGLDPLTAISMATINAANCFHLTDRGGVAPGRRADLILFRDLNDFRVEEVWIGGHHVANKGSSLVHEAHVSTKRVSGKMNVRDFNAKRLALPLKSNKVRTIQTIPYSITTRIGEALVSTDENGNWTRDEQDIVKIAVIERHKGTGNVGVGLFEGFGLKGGALAISVAHDSHNIMVVGDNDKDMEIAVNRLIEMGGGVSIAKEGVLLDSLEHEIAGLMTDRSCEYVAKRMSELEETARKELHIKESADPFMTPCFMALPVIPEIRITDMGIFDVLRFAHVPIEY